MAAKPIDQIITDIDAHIQKGGGGYKAWYVGITNDPRERLFTEHNVSEENAWWIYREAYSVDDARKVEYFFVNRHGTDGSPGGGDITSRCVYAYKKTASTNP